jgi:hypothetical protein
LHGFRRRAFAIRIFDAHQKLAAAMAGIKPVEKRGASTSDVQNPVGDGAKRTITDIVTNLKKMFNVGTLLIQPVLGNPLPLFFTPS